MIEKKKKKNKYDVSKHKHDQDIYNDIKSGEEIRITKAIKKCLELNEEKARKTIYRKYPNVFDQFTMDTIISDATRYMINHIQKEDFIPQGQGKGTLEGLFLKNTNWTACQNFKILKNKKTLSNTITTDKFEYLYENIADVNEVDLETQLQELVVKCEFSPLQIDIVNCFLDKKKKIETSIELKISKPYSSGGRDDRCNTTKINKEIKDMRRKVELLDEREAEIEKMKQKVRNRISFEQEKNLQKKEKRRIRILKEKNEKK